MCNLSNTGTIIVMAVVFIISCIGEYLVQRHEKHMMEKIQKHIDMKNNIAPQNSIDIISWGKNIKGITDKASKEIELKEKEQEAKRYKFSDYIKDNGKYIAEHILMELKKDIESTAKDGKSYILFGYNYSNMWACPKTFRDFYSYISTRFKYYKCDTDSNIIGVDDLYTPKWHCPINFDIESALKPYFNELGFNIGYNYDDTYGVLRLFYISWGK
jgi:hypothetical protein